LLSYPVSIGGPTVTKLETKVYGCDKENENSYKKEVFKETWSEVKSPRQANWAPTCQLQIHKPNPYFVEEEIESVDREFQESEFIDEKFEHK
jgi:hypothetical protein